MKIKLLIAVAATVVASSAMSQSAFQGFYGQIGAGYENNSVSSATSNFSGVPLSTPSTTQGNGQVNLGLGYNASVTQKFLLGVGVEYSTISSKPTTGQITSVNCGGNCDATQAYKISNRYSIFLTPGYAIEKDKLLYAKAGYSNQKLQSTLNETANLDANNGANLGSKSVNGYILGFGYKQMVSSGLYGFTEANYYSYSSASLNSTLPSGDTFTSNPKSSAYSFLVGVGYKF